MAHHLALLELDAVLNNIVAVLFFILLCNFAFGDSTSSSISFGNATYRVDSIFVDSRGVFNDVHKYSRAEQSVYNFLELLHKNTRAQVIVDELTFNVGDSISEHVIHENERNLRKLAFLSSASIQVQRDSSQQKNIVHIQTSDHWSLSVPVGLQKAGGQQIDFTIGLLESNFLGLGKSIGASYTHSHLQNQYLLEYQDVNLFKTNQKLIIQAAQNTDGYQYGLSLKKAYQSRLRNEWSWHIGAENKKDNLYVHKVPKTNDLIPLPTIYSDSVKSFSFSPTHNILQAYNGIRQDHIYLKIGKSFTGDLRYLMQANYAYEKQFAPTYTEFALFSDSTGQQWITNSFLFGDYNTRTDSRLGLRLTLEHFSFIKKHNFQKIKWTEDIPVGWSISSAAQKNLFVIGANNADWLFENFLQGSVAIQNNHILQSILKVQFRNTGVIEEIRTDWNSEFQWQWSSKRKTVLKQIVTILHNSPPYQQILLGYTNYMEAYPPYVLTGNSRFFWQWEERWFPSIEFGTVIPVLGVFMNSGNVYDNPHLFSFNDQIFTIGLNASFGMSKSIYGVINHFSICWPINGEFANGIKGAKIAFLPKIQL
jgi:hypothetical protein